MPDGIDGAPANDNPVQQRVAVIGAGERFEQVAAMLCADPSYVVTVGSLAPVQDDTLKLERSVGQAVGVAPVTVVCAPSAEELHTILFGRGAAAVSGPLNALFVDLSDVPAEITGFCAQRVAVLRKRYVSAARADLAQLAGEERFSDASDLLGYLGTRDARSERSLTA
jgi:hypothetical protein